MLEYSPKPNTMPQTCSRIVNPIRDEYVHMKNRSPDMRSDTLRFTVRMRWVKWPKETPGHKMSATDMTRSTLPKIMKARITPRPILLDKSE
jgi:hypothetical protein